MWNDIDPSDEGRLSSTPANADQYECQVIEAFQEQVHEWYKGMQFIMQGSIDRWVLKL